MSKSFLRAAPFALIVGMMIAKDNPVVPIAVIVNASNPMHEISPSLLREMLLGNAREWPNRRRITVVAREATSPVANAVFEMILGISAQEYNRYLLNLEFRGVEPVALKTLLSDESACDFVFNAPGAIGFVSAEALKSMPCGSQVKVVHIPEAGPMQLARKRESR